MAIPNIVVTGLGIISAAGLDVDSVWESIRHGRSGLTSLTSMGPSRWAEQPVGEIRADLASLGAPRAGSRSHKLIWLAIGQALAKARWETADRAWMGGAGLILGATTGGIRASESALEDWIVRGQRPSRSLAWHECASSTDLCARRLHLGGPTTTVSTACSSGALAISMAAELLVAGEADRMIAGGVDALCRLTINGFNSLKLVDPNGCRPFDARRAGMNLGEGAAALTLELEDAARRRGAPILARLCGWGTSCDAYHATAPHPEGAGAAAAMLKALASAGLGPEAIGYVNAHGTGTPDNDSTEVAALRSVFGSGIPPFSSTKRFFGHTLAASGAVEAVVSILALIRGELPPNLGFEREDAAIGLTPLTELTPAEPGHVMSNSFGFGGNNAVLIFGDAEKGPTGSATRRPNELASRAEIYVTGLGLVTAAGCRPEALFAAPGAGDVERSPVASADAVPEGKTIAYACKELPDREELDAKKRRRMNRLLKMAVIATRRARAAMDSPAPSAERTALCLGTGLGCLTDTGDFLANMIVENEIAPMPAKFIRSVHNAPAAQAAMEIGARGLNSAPTHREITFETALWQAMTELKGGRADVAFAGACDELSPYLIGVGRNRGWWTDDNGPLRPFEAIGEAPMRPTPGEGAVVIAMTAANATLADEGTNAAPTPLARVGPCVLGRWRPGASGDIDAEFEASCIESTLAGHGISLDGIDMLLTGANGQRGLDDMYLRTHGALERRAGRSIPLGAYKQLCGEFASASAVGFALAVGLVRGEFDGDTLCNIPDSAVPRPCGAVLLYTLSPAGSRAITCVRSVEHA